MTDMNVKEFKLKILEIKFWFSVLVKDVRTLIGVGLNYG
jgi:hypothetical protein